MKYKKRKILGVTGVSVFFTSLMLYGVLASGSIVGSGCSSGCGPTTTNDNCGNCTATCYPAQIKNTGMANGPGNCMVFSYTFPGPGTKLHYIYNPNLFEVTLFGRGATVALMGSTALSAAQMTTLFGSPTPALPVTINACGLGTQTFIYLALCYN